MQNCLETQKKAFSCNKAFGADVSVDSREGGRRDVVHTRAKQRRGRCGGGMIRAPHGGHGRAFLGRSWACPARGMIAILGPHRAEYLTLAIYLGRVIPRESPGFEVVKGE